TTTGDTGVGVSLAFNTIGWESQNVLNSTIDALIGTDIGDEQAAEVQAYITDTELTIGANLSLNAETKSTITSEVTNDSTSSATAMFNAASIAVSGIIASNMVSSSAKAYIDNSETQHNVQTGGNITINAKDDSFIKATNHLKAISTSKSDGGISLMSNLVDSANEEYDYTSKSGVQTLLTNDTVRIASDHEGDAVRKATYIYLGQDQEINLSSENFSQAYQNYYQILARPCLQILKPLVV
ncbi:hypothetical protein MHK_007409, partial [Candidatus Magnetomorum sp. HK-1]